MAELSDEFAVLHRHDERGGGSDPVHGMIAGYSEKTHRAFV